jgi:hypothetical protein
MAVGAVASTPASIQGVNQCPYRLQKVVEGEKAERDSDGEKEYQAPDSTDRVEQKPRYGSPKLSKD